MGSYQSNEEADIAQGLQVHFYSSPHYYLVKRDLQGRYTYVNPAYAKRFEFLNKSLIGEPFTTTVYGKTDLDKINNTIKQLIEKPNDIISIKIRKRTPHEDDWWWARWDFSAIKDGEGNVLEIISIGHDVTDSHRHELKALEYNLKINNILDSITDGFFVLSHDWTILRINKVFETTFNKKATNLIGENFWDLFPNTDSYQYPKAYKKAMSSRETVTFEEFFAEKWFLINVYPSLDGISIFFQDVTEKKIAAEKLKDNEIKLNAILNSTSDINFLIAPNYQVLLANKEGIRNVLALHHKEIKEGDDFRQYITNPSAVQDFEAHIKEAIAGREVRLERQIGLGDNPQKWFFYRYFPVYDSQNEIIGVSLNITDIDIIKQQQELLKERELKLSAILDSSIDLNVLIDLNYKVISFNKQAKERISAFVGKPLQEGVDFKEFILPSRLNLFQSCFEKATKGEIIEAETQTGRTSDIHVWHLMRYFPVYDEQQQLVAVSFNATNISEQKEKELKILKQNAMLREIAQIQSHEVRRPVATILGLMNLIKDDTYLLPRELQEYIEHLHKATQELDKVIHQVVAKTYLIDE